MGPISLREDFNVANYLARKFADTIRDIAHWRITTLLIILLILMLSGHIIIIIIV
jgi:hypothetical protein